jgi:lysophospholipase
MHLVESPENPVPPGALVEELRAVDGIRLRAARWIPEAPARGTVALFSGRTEFIEKYFETIGQLRDRGFVVVALDWRGQGGSERQLKNPRKGHIDDFSLYERDLNALVRQTLEPHCPRPWFGLCHSMGGAILLRIAEAGRCPFDRLVLSSPMIAVAGLRAPKLIRGLVEGLDALGLGGAFAPGGGNSIGAFAPFVGNVLTSDPVRYARTASIVRAEPSIALGGLTIGWLHAASRQMQRFEDPDFPRATTVPTLVIASGADRVTDTRATERFSERLRAGRLIVIEGAQHELLMERDVFRDQFWAAFDAFIPGFEGEQARAIA